MGEVHFTNFGADCFAVAATFSTFFTRFRPSLAALRASSNSPAMTACRTVSSVGTKFEGWPTMMLLPVPILTHLRHVALQMCLVSYS